MSYEKLEVTRGLMEAYVSMNAPQAENILEEVEQIDEKMTGLQAGGGNAAVQAAMRKDPNLSPIDAKLGVLKKGQAELNRQQTASQTAAARNTSSGQVQVSSNPIVRTFGGGQEKFKRDSSGNLTLDR